MRCMGGVCTDAPADGDAGAGTDGGDDTDASPDAGPDTDGGDDEGAAPGIDGGDEGDEDDAGAEDAGGDDSESPEEEAAIDDEGGCGCRVAGEPDTGHHGLERFSMQLVVPAAPEPSGDVVGRDC